MLINFENVAERKRQFYEDKTEQIEHLFQKRENELNDQEYKRAAQSGELSLRKIIEQENDLSALLTKLNNDERISLQRKMDSGSPTQKYLENAEFLKKQPSEYKFDDLDRKRHLMTFFMSKKKVKKQEKEDIPTSSYFEYRKKIYNNNEVQKKKDTLNEDKLSFKNPFFAQGVNRKFQKMINDLEEKYNPSSLEDLNLLSQRNKFEIMKDNIAQNSNTDANIIAIKQLYQMGLQTPKDEQAETSSLNISVNTSNETKRFLQKQQLLSVDRQPEGKTQVMLRSKHNMFRGKPARPFLLTLYQNNALKNKLTTQ